jgi:hypothetical protein
MTEISSTDQYSSYRDVSSTLLGAKQKMSDIRVTVEAVITVVFSYS